MIQGVFTGLRVLFWAVVLLVGCMYLLGVVTRTLFGNVDDLNVREEFSTVPAAMFTCFGVLLTDVRQQMARQCRST